jgi:hypothetical protein
MRCGSAADATGNPYSILLYKAYEMPPLVKEQQVL